MFTIEKMTEDMRPEVMAMVEYLYYSNDVSHVVDREKLEITFSEYLI